MQQHQVQFQNSLTHDFTSSAEASGLMLDTVLCL